MRCLLAIVLLVLLPFQFSWAAAAPYCGHETQVDVGHFGHHDHMHHADAGDNVGLGANQAAGLDTNAGAGDGKAPGAMDVDCGQCHGGCSVLLNLPSAAADTRSMAQTSATLDEDGGAYAPARPERPQWLPLA